jgi:hypothetical protein
LFNSYPDVKNRTLMFDASMGLNPGAYVLTAIDVTQEVS